MQALIEINRMRKEVGAQVLECSNRAVGVCENFSEIMAELCVFVLLLFPLMEVSTGTRA